MTSPTPQLTLDQCGHHVRDVVFGGALPADDPGRLSFGIELEWITADERHNRLDLEHVTEVVDALSPFPSGGRLTIEPGGQIELSSAPGHRFGAVCDATATDLDQLDRWCATRGIELVALGADPLRRPERILPELRYQAMEAYFDAMGPAGRTMMCNTASLQLNIGLGPPDEMSDRWQVANAIGPVLIASFANSPLTSGRPTGWVSSRLRSWWALDPTRSAPVDTVLPPEEAWLRFALDARVAFIRHGVEQYEPVIRRPLTFRRWIAEGNELGWPTLDDFVYHLTTLFPPVRPRGWFELRYLDALPTQTWIVAAAVAYSLVVDADARSEITALTHERHADHLWVDAAKIGLQHPVLRDTAPRVFAIARHAFGRVGVGDAVAEVVDHYVDRWVSRSRCPADDRLQAWSHSGQLLPSRESPVPYGRDVWTRPV